MKTKTLRAWIDKAGADDVAQRCGVGVDTIGRWSVGRPIPSTKRALIEAAHAAWTKEQAQPKATQEGDPS